MWRKALFFVICFLLAACSKNNPGLSPSEIKALPPDLSYFASDLCQAPCWQGITPGTTDKAASEKIVYGFIHSSATWNNGIFFNGYNEVGYSIELVFSEEKVMFTRIYPSEHKPRLEDVIDLLGHPDRVCLFLSEMADSVPSYETDIVFLKQGIWISSSAEFNEVDGKVQLKPSMDINEIVFFNPRDRFGLLGGDRTAKIVQSAQKWKGYTFYDPQFLYFEQLR